MSQINSYFAITSVLISSLAIFGCSSSGGGDGGTFVPANAIVITEANAYEVAVDAISGGQALLGAVPVAVNIDQKLYPRDLIDLAAEKINSLKGSFIQSIPSAVAIEPIFCSGGGSITGDVTETATSISGFFTFNSCIEAGITIDGTIDFSTSIDASENWTLTMTGNLSATDGVETMTLSGLSFNQTGNDVSGEYSINTYQFTVDFTGGGGFNVQLQADILGNEFKTCFDNPSSPRSGIVLVTGGSNTKSRATINADGTVSIEWDDGSGTFTEVTIPAPGSPFPCSGFFV